MSFQKGLSTYEKNQAERRMWARGRCEADGLHHADCPGEATTATASRFVTHHVHPRELGGVDDVVNLRYVYNGTTGLGAGACHAMIHNNRVRAKELGLLSDGDDKWR